MANLKFSFIVLLIFVCVLTLTGEYKVTVPTNQVRVSAGEDVILNCEVEPDIDLTKKTVEWKYFDTSTKKELWVHMFRNGKDDPDSQDDKFKKRTFLFHDKLKEGNLSLKLLSVNLSDEGIYTCIVNKLDGSIRRGQIQLIVTARKKQEQQQNESDSDSNALLGVLGLVLSSVSVIILVVIITGLV